MYYGLACMHTSIVMHGLSREGEKSGDGQKLPPEVRQYIKEKWQEIVTAKLGFQNLREMREAWHKEQKQKVKSV